MKKICTLLFCTVAMNGFAQSLFPAQTKQEMYADFDTLYKTLLSVNPHDFVRKTVNKYAMLDSIKALRKHIEQIKTTEEFFWLINKALTYCQDDHTSVVSKRFYPFIDSLDRVRLRTNISDTSRISFYSKIRRSRIKSMPLRLPIKYIDGQYKVLQTFTLRGKTIEQGSTLTHYNEQAIAVYLKSHLGDIEALHWDFERKIWHKDEFYQGNHIPINQENVLTFSYKGNRTDIKASLSDTIQLNQADKSTLEVTDTKPFITFFNEPKILYIRMPEMSNKDFYIQQLDSIRKRINTTEISKIIWDIRGNAGGDD
ncbi:MAG: hypothetical protein ACKVTZ_07625, partial [Bacteroidia bacterium]